MATRDEEGATTSAQVEQGCHEVLPLQDPRVRYPSAVAPSTSDSPSVARVMSNRRTTRTPAVVRLLHDTYHALAGLPWIYKLLTRTATQRQAPTFLLSHAGDGGVLLHI